MNYSLKVILSLYILTKSINFMKHLFAIGFAAFTCLQAAVAQDATCAKAVGGTWRIDNGSSYVKITPQSGCNFNATVHGSAATGSIAGNKTVTVTETGSKVTYTGEVQADGSIRGTTSTNAKFVWVKVCESGMAMKTASKYSTKEFFGEKRNEAIPLMTVFPPIPAGAIFKGNIGIGERTVNLETANANASSACNYEDLPAVKPEKVQEMSTPTVKVPKAPKMTLKR